MAGKEEQYCTPQRAGHADAAVGQLHDLGIGGFLHGVEAEVWSAAAEGHAVRTCGRLQGMDAQFGINRYRDVVWLRCKRVAKCG